MVAVQKHVISNKMYQSKTLYSGDTNSSLHILCVFMFLNEALESPWHLPSPNSNWKHMKCCRTHIMMTYWNTISFRGVSFNVFPLRMIVCSKEIVSRVFWTCLRDGSRHNFVKHKENKVVAVQKHVIFNKIHQSKPSIQEIPTPAYRYYVYSCS